jgi:hypothetical protein
VAQATTVLPMSELGPAAGRSRPRGVAFPDGKFGKFDVGQPRDLLPFRGRSRGLSYASRRRDSSS